MPDSTFASAVALHRAGKMAEAAALYRQILQREPTQADALFLLASIELQSGRPSQAHSLLEKARLLQPKEPEHALQLGLTFRALGQQQKAIESFRAALELDPRLAEAHHQLGNSLKTLRRFSEALPELRRASELQPSDPIIWMNLGVTQLELAQLDAAVASFRFSLELAPGRADAYNILGTVLMQQGKLAEAKQALSEALHMQPTYSAAHDNLGRLLRAQGNADEAIVHFRAALNVPNPSLLTHSNLLYALNFSPTLAPEAIFAEHQQWGARYAEPLRTTWRPHENALAPNRRLRIGYVSPDFVHHAVSYFFEPVLASHDRGAFEIYCYSNAGAPDYVTTRLKALCSQWREIAGVPDEQVAEMIRKDRIDLLVDLAGHTARHRLLTFARKPAPIQLTWLGYPNTTGVSAIDYRIAESFSDPAGSADALHTENLIRLPEAFSCYQPPAESPAVSPLPAAKSGFVTFGSFNHGSKLNSAVMTLWTQLLQRLPNARLFLKTRSLIDEATASEVRALFARAGVADRIELNGEELSVAAHLSLYHHVDIALDPFPYSGTTTSCEALWMGVPVITRAGRTHVSRVTASLLTHLGSPEWIAYSEEDYLQLAISLAENIERLAGIRQGLRERMRTSPLCDAPRFTRHLEEAYRAAWRNYINKP